MLPKTIARDALIALLTPPATSAETVLSVTDYSVRRDQLPMLNIFCATARDDDISTTDLRGFALRVTVEVLADGAGGHEALDTCDALEAEVIDLLDNIELAVGFAPLEYEETEDPEFDTEGERPLVRQRMRFLTRYRTAAGSHELVVRARGRSPASWRAITSSPYP